MGFKPTWPPGMIKSCAWCHRPFLSTKPLQQRFCCRQCKQSNRRHIRMFAEGWKQPNYHKPKGES